MKKWFVIALAALTTAAVIGVSMFVAARTRSLPEPARTVQAALELRAQNSTDVAAYERAFEETSVAASLVQDAAKQKKSGSPIPRWKPPRVVSSDESSATVLVHWKLSGRFEDWPQTASFVLHKVGGKWVIVDALEPGADESPK